MFGNIFSFLSGYCVLTVCKGNRRQTADALYRNGVKCFSTHILDDGSMRVKVPLYTTGRVKHILTDEGIEYDLSDIKGLPFYLRLLIKRPGLGIGFLLFFFIMHLSGDSVWYIDIKGNEKYSDEFIVNQLEELGFTYGTYIPSVDFDQLHSEYLARFSEISWISVNMNGTYANVQVREKRLGGDAEHKDGKYANIVASEDGIISHEETSSGVSLVSGGDVVRKGELLVSGVIPLRNGGERFTYAESKVYAYVPRYIEVEIPFEIREKVYSGEEYTKKTAKIFKKSINLSINSGFEYTTYDKIEGSMRASVFDVIPLPIWIEKKVYKEYYYEYRTLTKEDAVSRARAELRDRLDEVLENAELTSSKISYEVTADSFIIKCELTCLADIARVVEFNAYVSDIETTEEKN